MANLEISPRSTLDNMCVGEETAYELDITDELGSKTIDSIAYAIFNSGGEDVSGDFDGGDSEVDGIITFGVIAAAVGTYTLQFTITCVDTLPDTTTPYEFIVKLTVIVE